MSDRSTEREPALLGLACRLAARELRAGFSSGLRGFRVFVACLALGVGTIAGVGSLAAALSGGLRDDGARLLGGDAEFRTANHGIAPDVRRWLDRHGVVSEVREQRAMLRSPDETHSAVIALKAVDARYPLYGAVKLAPDIPLAEALAPDAAGVPGIAVDPLLLSELGVRPGDPVRLGERTYRIAATLVKAPDGGEIFSFGIPAMVSLSSIAGAGLDRVGILSSRAWRVRLDLRGSDRQSSGAGLVAAARARFPDVAWQTRDSANAAPALQGVIDHLSGFLDLVGLTALLVGGVGVGNAVTAQLEASRRSIAILKALGGSGRLVLATWLTVILALALTGIGLGLTVGAALPALAAAWFGDRLPIALDIGLHPGPLALGAGFGLLSALAFSLGPLGRTRDIPPAILFRSLDPARTLPLGAASRLAVLGTGVLLAALVFVTAPDRRLAFWFAAGAVGLAFLLGAAGWAVTRLARFAPHLADPMLRHALADLGRPGAKTGALVLSLGLGLTVLIAIAAVEHALSRELSSRIPADAPSYFFIDIEPDRRAPFEALIRRLPGVTDFAAMPNLRTRIVAVDGVPAERAKVEPGARVLLDSERGLTYAADLPAGSTLVAGRWWPSDYAGPPLISLDADFARDLHIGPGHRLTFDIAGRQITATVANLRKIDWSSLGINFFTIFAPGTLEPAPQTFVATARVSNRAAEAGLQQAVTKNFPDVVAIRVRDALDRLAGLLQDVGLALASVALVATASGVLVLAGAIAAGQRRQLRDAVIFKVLGATRLMLLRGLAFRYGFLGLSTGAVAAVFGSLAAWAATARALKIPFHFNALQVVAIGGAGLVLVVVLGVAGTWRSLGAPPSRSLRLE